MILGGGQFDRAGGGLPQVPHQLVLRRLGLLHHRESQRSWQREVTMYDQLTMYQHLSCYLAEK